LSTSIVNRNFHAALPRLLEVYSGYCRKNLYHKRCNAHAEKGAGQSQVFGSEGRQGRTELGEGGVQSFAILGVWLYKDVEVFRSAGLCMKSNCITTNDQVLNLVGR
jgi:hypothetical protein